MKSWQLTLVSVKSMKELLRAVERTQLEFYGIDSNFKEIEERLTKFLAKVRDAREAHENGSVHKLEYNQGANYVTDQH